MPDRILGNVSVALCCVSYSEPHNTELGLTHKATNFPKTLYFSINVHLGKEVQCRDL